MTRTEMATLLSLWGLHRKLDAVLGIERREEERMLKIQDVLDRAGTSLDALAADDAELIALAHSIQESGGTLTADQENQANAALARIDSLDAADKQALADLGHTGAPTGVQSEGEATLTDTGAGITDEGSSAE